MKTAFWLVTFLVLLTVVGFYLGEFYRVGMSGKFGGEKHKSVYVEKTFEILEGIDSAWDSLWE